MGHLFHPDGTPFAVKQTKGEIDTMISNWSATMEIPIPCCKISSFTHSVNAIAMFDRNDESNSGLVTLSYFFHFHSKEYLRYVVIHELVHALQWYIFCKKHGLIEAARISNEYTNVHDSWFQELRLKYQPDYCEKTTRKLETDFKRYVLRFEEQGKRFGRCSRNELI